MSGAANSGTGPRRAFRGPVTTALAHRPGDTVTLTVLRDGDEQEVEVTLGEKGALFD
jgi:S1-C subfamily serine protease